MLISYADNINGTVLFLCFKRFSHDTDHLETCGVNMAIKGTCRCIRYSAEKRSNYQSNFIESYSKVLLNCLHKILLIRQVKSITLNINMI